MSQDTITNDFGAMVELVQEEPRLCELLRDVGVLLGKSNIRDNRTLQIGFAQALMALAYDAGLELHLLRPQERPRGATVAS